MGTEEDWEDGQCFLPFKTAVSCAIYFLYFLYIFLCFRQQNYQSVTKTTGIARRNLLIMRHYTGAPIIYDMK
jgi:hypothetical protein